MYYSVEAVAIVHLPRVDLLVPAQEQVASSLGHACLKEGANASIARSSWTS